MHEQEKPSGSNQQPQPPIFKPSLVVPKTDYERGLGAVGSVRYYEMEFVRELLGSQPSNADVHREHIAAKAASLAKTDEEVAAVQKSVKDMGLSDGKDVEEEVKKSLSVFHKDEVGYYLCGYQVKGFFKAAVTVLIDLKNESVKNISKWGCKRTVDGFLFVKPVPGAPSPLPGGVVSDRLHLYTADGRPLQESDLLTRPLRADTMKGARVALVTSQMLPPGARIRFAVELLECTPVDPTAPEFDVNEEDHGEPAGQESGYMTETSTPAQLAKRNKAKKSKLKKARKPAALMGWDGVSACLNYGSRIGMGQWRNAGYGQFNWDQINLS